MHLGRTGSAADSVTSGPSSKKNNHIPGGRGFTNHVLSGSSSHNGSDLHPLGHIAGMIDFFYIAGGKTDLVSIGAVAMSRLRHQLSLGKLSL